MDKIIDFSSVFEGTMIDNELKSIHKQLLKESLDQDKLYDLTEKLETIFEYISEKMSKSAQLTDIISEKKLEVGRLLNSCYSKWIDKEINLITEDIQKLSSVDSNGNTLEKIDDLKSSISELTFNNALSLENKHLIQLAKTHLNEIETGRANSDLSSAQEIRIEFQDYQSKRDPIDDHEIALTLYEMSGRFYNNDIKSAIELFYSLPEKNRLELTDILEARGASIEAIKTVEDFGSWQKNLFIVIQTSLGYANHVVDGLSAYHFPEKDEIIELFNDPFFNQNDTEQSI